MTEIVTLLQIIYSAFNFLNLLFLSLFGKNQYLDSRFLSLFPGSLPVTAKSASLIFRKSNRKLDNFKRLLYYLFIKNLLKFSKCFENISLIN